VTHKVLHVELVHALAAFAFLLGEPAIFFPNVGKPGTDESSSGASIRISNSLPLSHHP
jgi:hypothetical protein